MILHRTFLIRDLRRSGKQALIFVLCAALSLTTLVAINRFKEDVHRSILADARALQGGDVIVHSHYTFSAGLEQAISSLVQQQIAICVRTYEFYSMVRGPAGDNTLLARIKVVGPGYPLYGRISLKSGRGFADTLRPGRVVVEQEVLDRLHLHVGDTLDLGTAALRIAGIVTHEPRNGGVNIFSLGPRVFVAAADLAQLGLLRKGSRVEYLALLKVHDQQNIAQVAAKLKHVARPGLERVDTFRTARSRVKRFLDNLLFFLSLIGIFTLLLAGIGMQSSLAALLREKEKTIAITRVLGATPNFLLFHYLLIVLFLGLAGSGLGIAAGIMVERYLPTLFAGLIPAGIKPGGPTSELAAGLLLGLIVVLLFTFLPLRRLNQVKPIAIFRSETAPAARGASFYLALVFGLLLLAVLVIRQLEDMETGLYFTFGALLLILVIAALTRLVLAAGSRIVIPSLALRQAFRGLFRPGNATGPIVITLAAALAVLLTISLVENNLRATFIESYPAGAPNLFCLDIQPDQKQPFSRTIPVAAQFYPIVRARLMSINGRAVNRRKELQKRSDNLAREFNLTYRDKLLEDENIVAGKSLFRQNWHEKDTVQVSILDTVEDIGDIRLNDLLQFNIQGVPLQARVTSIRSRTRSRLYPFFYFVFPERALHDAPHTFFAALHADKNSVSQLENRIVAAFPNVSLINVTETAAELAVLLRRLVAIVDFFAMFSIIAGVLITVSSVFATRLARIREAVYYKILGAGSFFVVTVLACENMLLGLLSSLFGLILAQSASWALCRYMLDIPYHPRWPTSLLVVLLTILAVTGIGLASSVTIIRRKPVTFLREQEE